MRGGPGCCCIHNACPLRAEHSAGPPGVSIPQGHVTPSAIHPDLTLEETSLQLKLCLQMVQCHHLNTNYILTTPKCMPPAWISPRDSRFILLTAYLAFPRGCLIVISNVTCLKPALISTPTVLAKYLFHLPFFPNSVNGDFFFPAARPKPCVASASIPRQAPHPSEMDAAQSRTNSEFSHSSSPPPCPAWCKLPSPHPWRIPTASQLGFKPMPWLTAYSPGSGQSDTLKRCHSSV